MISAHALLRIASGTSGILIGLSLATLSNRGAHLNAGLVGTLSAVSFAAELSASLPMGIASDRVGRRRLMTAGALAGAAAAVLFAISGRPSIFFLSRALEGIGAAAIVPALLAYLADATERRAALRARVMSYFELTLLAGLALGGIAAAQLFRAMQGGAFFVVALVYATSAAMLFLAICDTGVRSTARPIADLRSVLRLPSIRRLAPVWLCVNAVVGLWLGPTLPFLLTRRSSNGQYLSGLFAADPARVGWLLFAYALIFGAGISAWSMVLPHVRLRVALWISLGAMLPACAGIYLLNHSAHQTASVRWTIGAVMALVVMIESGFTPAALAWLAGSLPPQSGRGAGMGVYSVLLGVGAIVGSLLAAILGQAYSVDGLLYGTALAAVAAGIFLRWVPDDPRLRYSEHDA